MLFRIIGKLSLIVYHSIVSKTVGWSSIYIMHWRKFRFYDSLFLAMLKKIYNRVKLTLPTINFRMVHRVVHFYMFKRDFRNF
jgi:hypothetical protein